MQARFQHSSVTWTASGITFATGDGIAAKFVCDDLGFWPEFRNKRSRFAAPPSLLARS